MSLRNESMARPQYEASGPSDYSNFQNQTISPEMLNFGLSAGQDILNRQKARLMPGVSDFFSNLKIYFAVSNTYVIKKLSIVLAPMRNQCWGRIPADEAARDGDRVRALSKLTPFRRLLSSSAMTN